MSGTWRPETPETIADIASGLRAEGVTEAEVTRMIAAAVEADEKFTARMMRGGAA